MGLNRSWQLHNRPPEEIRTADLTVLQWSTHKKNIETTTVLNRMISRPPLFWFWFMERPRISCKCENILYIFGFRLVQWAKSSFLCIQNWIVELQFFRVVVEGIIIQCREIQKLANRHIKRQRNFVKRLYTGIFWLTVYNIVQSWLLHVTHSRQPINREISLPT